MGHLSRLIGGGRVALGEVVKLPSAELDLIRGTLLEGAGAGRIPLRPAYEKLGGVYDWDTLRCVAAELDRSLDGIGSGAVERN
jgi:hypothetical protein